MVTAGLGTGSCHEQAESRELRLRHIAGIRTDDIPAEARRRLTVKTHTHTTQAGTKPYLSDQS